METLGRYILSVVAAAMVLGIFQALTGKNSSSTLLRFIGGIFLTFTVIRPICTLDLSKALDLPLSDIRQGNVYAEQGSIASRTELEAIIKEQCEAYILDKARSCQAQLEVEVVLSQDDVPAPESVTLRGNVSPYQRQLLQSWLEEQMGIQGACQIWIG